MDSLPILGLATLNLIVLVVALLRIEAELRWEYIVLSSLFFLSGMPALVYQIVWARALFAIYGVNAESVVVVVSVFMLGLGLGSLLGGWLSARFPSKGIFLFGLAELGTALFGLCSLRIFGWAARFTAGAGLPETVVFSFVLLIVPTMLMGSTLPILVEHLVRSSRRVGSAVGMLYFANTFGSSVACALCAIFVLRDFGQSGSVAFAALVNTVVGGAAVLYVRSVRHERAEREAGGLLPAPGVEKQPLNLPLAMLLAGFSGFIALAFEIAWFRTFSLASADRAPAFALLLSAYLGGIAFGACVLEIQTEKRSGKQVVAIVGMLLLLAGAISPYLPPLVALLMAHNMPYLFGAPAFFLVAALVGSLLPLICKLTVPPDEAAGRRVSLIYLSNIVGSTLGSLLVGFVLMQYFGIRQISIGISLLAILTGGAVIVFLAQDRLTGIPVRGLTFVLLALLCLPLAARLYSHFFERLIFGVRPEANDPFAHIVENRNAVIAVTRDGAVFNGGVYDGYFNIDPTNDVNTVVRVYALSAFHPNPKRMFLLGLSTGSWAQILANHPQLERMDVVEINPGTLQLIPQYPMVRSLLSNPKVHIHIDDARRWLLAHPDERYDAIVANGSFYWRDHSSYVLSAEFLRLVRAHLNTGGVYYYNSTESSDVLSTGLSVYPYALRVINFLAVSDSPIRVNADRWMNILSQYKIDGAPVFDPSNASSARVLEAYAALAGTINEPPRFMGMESNTQLRERLTGGFIFTDDNMGWDWRNGFEIPWRTPVTQSALVR